ncbi:hypothetical protein [Propionispora hippei]|uniref:Uncharacterized protein n=1 Tax=Propionispora hippei DSM 15287 TaxID=1123003 RepID=A0A1M6FZJ0_9FIRM|nr:hypothetical protein [Propionispora hippei]SHJ03096.1 hypothetical protein SAMN02745170_01564 [Propionispora hippei DSM 15287]
MAIDQNGLNSLLAAFTPYNNMTALREQRANLLRRLQQSTEVGKPDNVLHQEGDRKSDLRQLAAVDQQIAQTMYDEVAGRLEEERLKREAALARKERDKERALARHERFLENRSMSKLLSAAGRTTAEPRGLYSNSLSNGQGDKSYTSDVERDVQESVQYGIAAAEVASRRKNAESKAQVEESGQRHRTVHRKKNKSVNITV